MIEKLRCTDQNPEVLTEKEIEIGKGEWGRIYIPGFR